MSCTSTVTGDTTGETTWGEVPVTAVIDLTDDEPEAAGTRSSAAGESRVTASEPFIHLGRKRPASGGEQPRKRIKISNPKEETLEEGRAVFEAKYKQQHRIGKGGFGCVYAGYRREDSLPVAIKCISKARVLFKFKMRDGRTIPMEVAVMKELAAGPPTSVGTQAPVFLLDWYELSHQLILVLEMPVPCMDLDMYMWNNSDSMEEEQAKTIMKQLVDAVNELEANDVFHRDIKVQNILIETGADVPRVRLIDFGISCFCKKNSSFSHFYGTLAHIPPECLAGSGYKAGPTTVWQLGVALFEMMHSYTPFDTDRFLNRSITISRMFSADCQDLLQMCLSAVPEDRPTLKEIQCHPWLT